jgi:hypothetical protein
VLDRRRRVGGSDVVERFVIKSVCKPLSVREAFAAGRFDLRANALGRSTRDLCGHICPVGQRPLILVRHYPSDRSNLYRDELWPPADQLSDAAVVSAGICMRRVRDEVHVLVGTTFARRSGAGWRLLPVKKDAVLPLAEDASRIEWVP